MTTFNEAVERASAVTNPELGQSLEELEQLYEHLSSGGYDSYLEIGCLAGGSLMVLAQALPVGSVIVGIDLPYLVTTEVQNPMAQLGLVWQALTELGYRVNVLLGDSHEVRVVTAVMELMNLATAFCFIDGDHSTEGLRLDWAYYGRKASGAGIHDTVLIPEVRKVWEGLAAAHTGTVQELVASGERQFGIGILH